MVNEKKTDIFIASLLKEVNINFVPNEGINKEVNDALQTASKELTENPGYPEFTASSKDFILVIEDKAEISKQVNIDFETQKLATDVNSIKNFAENGALHYAKHIVENSSFKKVFAFGCSGDEKHHIIRPIFVDEDHYELLEEVENFENFNEKNIDKYYHEIVLKETPQEEIELENLIKKSKQLNEHLRNYGQLGDSEKPLVISAILLALNEKENLTDDLNGDSISTDGKKIYEKMSDNLERSKVGNKKDTILNQFTIIKDRTKLNSIDERLGKTPLKFFTEFIKNEIFPSISTAKADILGYFYSEFIKYSGGDGQTLGIVLTPKHITELFCELLDVKPSDKIFDPCCGTGSFLIAGMNQMIELSNDTDEIYNIKKNNIHGIEIREDMFTIATTNMILRGDGKSNLKLADFFDYDAKELKKENFTVGLMNPPYSQGSSEAPDLYEINFVKHLLDSLAENARCAVIVPQSTMAGKYNEDKKIKKEIYKHHTIEGVITLNSDTFYRVGNMPCIAIFTTHQPHPENKRCKFINFEDDGYKIARNIGLVKTERAKERKKHLIECWKYDKDAESKFMVKTKIKPEDEWLHSFYYFNDEIPSNSELENVMADYLSFEFDMISHGKDYLFEE